MSLHHKGKNLLYTSVPILDGQIIWEQFSFSFEKFVQLVPLWILISADDYKDYFHKNQAFNHNSCMHRFKQSEQKYAEQFKWSLNYHFKARSPLFSMVFVQVSLDGLPSDMEKRCRSFWDPFLRETTAFMVLGGTGYDRNQLDSSKQPFKSRTSSNTNQQDFTLLELC